MDIKNRISSEIDFQKIAYDECKLLYRQNSEESFTEMIKENSLNHNEYILIKEYLQQIFVRGIIKDSALEFDTTYFKFALELAKKIRRDDTFFKNIFEINERNKFNINEMEILHMFCISKVMFGINIAILKSI
jgi:hypothetical protein